MIFRVGQKVACIRFFDNPLLSPEVRAILQFPVVGATYVIRDIGDCCVNATIQSGVRLQEIINPSYTTARFGFREPFFRACDFRPIVERKTSIEVFTRMLNSNKQEIEA